MRQLVIGHDLPFASDAIPIAIGLVVLVVVLVAVLVALVWLARDGSSAISSGTCLTSPAPPVMPTWPQPID
jgi:hypothetical protein